MLAVPIVEFAPDHRQVHRPLDDLVVVPSLHGKMVTFKHRPHTETYINVII